MKTEQKLNSPEQKLNMKLLTSEILADIKAAAFLESELHPELDLHRRHEMADICEAPNVERVWRLIALHASEVRVLLMRLSRPGGHDHRPCKKPGAERFPAQDNILETPGILRFQVPWHIADDVKSFLKEKAHDYILSRVMADRCAVIIPTAAPHWRARGDDAMEALRKASAAASQGLRPVRRPLPPL